MARIRSIKPEFFTSEQIVECSTSARLLFVGLWCFCDDGGVHPASIKRLKMEVFPADPVDDAEITSWMEELIANGLVETFVSQGQQYWYVTGWRKHQRIDRPTLKHPQYGEPDSTTTRRGLDECSSSVRPRIGEEGIGEERKGVEGSGEERTEEQALPLKESDQDAFLTFPIKGTPSTWGLSSHQLEDLSETYPNLDVQSECRKARLWCVNNPAKRKTAKGMPKFLSTWMNNAQKDSREPFGRSHNSADPRGNLAMAKDYVVNQEVAYEVAN